jgi:hypothetical protein
MTPAFVRMDGLPSASAVAPDSPRRLQLWAQSLADDAGGSRTAATAPSEHLAALSLMANREQKRLLECVGCHPLLAEAELGLVLAMPWIYTRRAIEKSLRLGLVTATIPASGGSPRFYLSEIGLRLLAARDGVPLRRYATHSHFAAALPGAEGGRLQTLLRQLEHTTGANSFFVRGLVGSPPGGPKLVTWLSAFEPVTRFQRDGVRRWIRPDGAGDVEQGGIRYPFFLEWDRGTERIAVLLEKLDRYASYYRTLGPHDGPALLFVTTTPQREDVVWRAVTAVSRGSDVLQGRVLTTAASLVELRGPFGTIWRTARLPVRAKWPSGDTMGVEARDGGPPVTRSAR